MRIGESMRVAGTAIAANRLRSALTILGVVIGVMSVVLLVAVGTGARDEVTGSVERLGSNLLIVFPGEFDGTQPPGRSVFTLDDVERLRRDLPPGVLVTTNLSGGETARAEGVDARVAIIGVTGEYPEITNRRIVRGQFFGESDVAVGRRTVVLDQQAAEALFRDRDPLTREITVRGLRFRVAGVIEDFQGAAFGPQPGAQMYVPVTAAQRLFGLTAVDSLLVQAPHRDDLAFMQAEVERILTEGVRGRDRAVSVITQDEILGVAGQILDTLTLVLAAIAGISLLVGGIGVSNIMLVSVSERTREVGLRKALGARTRDITVQFLVEAVVLCGVGGLVGVAVGIGLAELAVALTPLPATVTTWSVLTAFGVSLGVGVVFGVYPAWRAGRLDPVVALRYE